MPQGRHDAQLLFRRGAGKDHISLPFEDLAQLDIRQAGDLFLGEERSPLIQPHADRLGHGLGGAPEIPGYHDDANAGPLALFYGRGDLGPGRVNHPGDPQKAEIAFRLGLGQLRPRLHLLPGQGQEPEALLGQVIQHLDQAGPVPGRERAAATVPVGDGAAQGNQGIRGPFHPAAPRPPRRGIDGAHAFAHRLKREDLDPGLLLPDFLLVSPRLGRQHQERRLGGIAHHPFAHRSQGSIIAQDGAGHE